MLEKIILNIGWRNNTNGFCIARNSNDDLQSGEQFQIGPTGITTFSGKVNMTNGDNALSLGTTASTGGGSPNFSMTGTNPYINLTESDTSAQFHMDLSSSNLFHVLENDGEQKFYVNSVLQLTIDSSSATFAGNVVLGGAESTAALANRKHYLNNSASTYTAIAGGDMTSSTLSDSAFALKLYPWQSNTRTIGDFGAALGFYHLDPNGYYNYGAGAAAAIALKLYDTPAAERSRLVIMVNSSTSVGSVPNIEALSFEPTAGNATFVGAITAASYADNTPYPKSLDLAKAAVLSHQKLPDGQYDENNTDNQLDHSFLHEYVSGDEKTRNVSATVSCLVEVIKDLMIKVEALENA